MAIKVYEFAPNQAKDTSDAGTETDGSTVDGIKKRLNDAHGSANTVDAMTTYMIGGNLYVIVAT